MNRPPRRGVRAMLAGLLRTGTSPRDIARCLAAGLAGSVCPIVGTATPILAVVAVWRRLNLPLIQAVNYAATPLQWLLIVPFLRLGEWVFRAEALPLSPRQIIYGIKTDPRAFFAEFSMAAVHAAAGWLLMVAPIYLLVRAIAAPWVARATRKQAERNDRSQHSV